MNTLEKFLLLTTALAVFLLAGTTKVSYTERAELAGKIEAMELDLGIKRNKDGVRDQWMRAHSSELMNRIEGRTKK